MDNEENVKGDREGDDGEGKKKVHKEKRKKMEPVRSAVGKETKIQGAGREGE